MKFNHAYFVLLFLVPTTALAMENDIDSVAKREGEESVCKMPSLKMLSLAAIAKHNLYNKALGKTKTGDYRLPSELREPIKRIGHVCKAMTRDIAGTICDDELKKQVQAFPAILFAFRQSLSFATPMDYNTAFVLTAALRECIKGGIEQAEKENQNLDITDFLDRRLYVALEKVTRNIAKILKPEIKSALTKNNDVDLIKLLKPLYTEEYVAHTKRLVDEALNLCARYGHSMEQPISSSEWQAVYHALPQEYKYLFLNKFFTGQLAQNGKEDLVDEMAQLTNVLTPSDAEIDISDFDIQELFDAACKHGHTNVVEKLLNLYNDKLSMVTPFIAAALADDVTIGKLLYKCGANKDFQAIGMAGMYAIINNSAAFIKFLISQGFDTTIYYAHSNLTPLCLAIFCGHNEIIKILLNDAKASVDNPDFVGRYPLLHAAEYGDEETFEIILNSKPFLIIKDRADQTVFHYAVAGRDTKKLRALLEVYKNKSINDRPDINAGLLVHEIVDPSFRSATALHYAALNGLKEMVELLVEHGADVCCITEVGETPAVFAQKAGHQEIAEFLFQKQREAQNSQQNSLQETSETSLDGKQEE